MKKITVYSDGACDGNPGPGGWAAVLQYGERCREIAGYTIATTNNRMELQAAIEALQVLKEPCQIDFYTDSEYLRDGITSWIDTWKRKGWRTAERKPVKNADLWKQLDSVRTSHQISWHWVKGHAGNPWNERCDLLATEQIRFLRQKLKPEELSQALADFKARHSAYPAPPSSHTGTQPTSPQNLELSFE